MVEKWYWEVVSGVWSWALKYRFVFFHINETISKQGSAQAFDPLNRAIASHQHSAPPVWGSLSIGSVGFLLAYKSQILFTQISALLFWDSEHTNLLEPLRCLRHANKQDLRDLFTATSKIWSSPLLPLKHHLGTVTFLLQTAFHQPLYYSKGWSICSIPLGTKDIFYLQGRTSVAVSNQMSFVNTI